MQNLRRTFGRAGILRRAGAGMVYDQTPALRAAVEYMGGGDQRGAGAGRGHDIDALDQVVHGGVAAVPARQALRTRIDGCTVGK